MKDKNGIIIYVGKAKDLKIDCLHTLMVELQAKLKS